MGMYELLKDSASLIAEFKDTPHYEKIVALRDQLIALSEEKIRLYEENLELKGRLQDLDDFTFKAPFYFRKDDDHPFCQRCLDSDRKTVRLFRFRDVGEHSYVCKQCNVYYD